MLQYISQYPEFYEGKYLLRVLNQEEIAKIQNNASNLIAGLKGKFLIYGQSSPHENFVKLQSFMSAYAYKYLFQNDTHKFQVISVKNNSTEKFAQNEEVQQSSYIILDDSDCHGNPILVNLDNFFKNVLNLIQEEFYECSKKISDVSFKTKDNFARLYQLLCYDPEYKAVEKISEYIFENLEKISSHIICSPVQLQSKNLLKIHVRSCISGMLFSDKCIDNIVDNSVHLSSVVTQPVNSSCVITSFRDNSTKALQLFYNSSKCILNATKDNFEDVFYDALDDIEVFSNTVSTSFQDIFYDALEDIEKFSNVTTTNFESYLINATSFILNPISPNATQSIVDATQYNSVVGDFVGNDLYYESHFNLLFPCISCLAMIVTTAACFFVKYSRQPISINGNTAVSEDANVEYAVDPAPSIVTIC